MTQYIVRADHVNGYVKCALIRNEVDVRPTIIRLESAGYWTHVRIDRFEPRAVTRRRR